MKGEREMKSKLTENDIINWWLKKYHNTTTEEILKNHPEWAEGDHSREFYTAYQVTQAQHDEWWEWVITALMKELRVSRKYIKRRTWAVYLNLAPMVKEQ